MMPKRLLHVICALFIFGNLCAQTDTAKTGVVFTRVEGDPIWCINSEGLYGAVDQSNTPLIPFVYEHVSKELYNTPICYIALLPGGSGAIYSTSGELLISFEFDDLESICTQQEKFYVRIRQNGKTALGYWDVSAKKIVRLTKFEFDYIDCISTTKEPFAAGHYNNGTYVHLFKDGKKKKP